MIISVDAYNVLKTVLHIQFVQERQRRQFLQLFMQYAQIRPSNQVLLIFDGGSVYINNTGEVKLSDICRSGGTRLFIDTDDTLK